jgi:hypothetical protein
MAKKILSFEEYQVQLKSEQDNVDTTEEVENEECPCGEDEDGNCLPCEDETPSEIEDEEIDDEDDDSDDDTDDVEDDADEDGDDDDDDDEDEDDDEEDDDDDEEEAEESDEEESEEEVEAEDGEEGEEVEEAPEAEAEAEAEPAVETMTVETMLVDGYAKVKEAACAYEKDEYQDHTLEMYMKENAALVATLAAKAMEEGYGEVKDIELTKEMYEAHCNEMKDAYAKKMDELKETYGAGKE